MAHLRSARRRSLPLPGEWLIACAEPGAIADPSAPELDGLEWLPMRVPGTAAAALAEAGRWSLDERRDFDAHDWWFRITFDHPAPDAPAGGTLVFGGLATVADVWLNGARILQSDNMFLEHEVVVEDLRPSDNVLVIRCASVNAWLTPRRPRPAWRTRLVKHQQLRWLRTTLIGRIPAWMPFTAPVGPWRPVEFVVREVAPHVRRADIQTGWTGEGGWASVRLDVEVGDTVEIDRAVFTVNGNEIALERREDADGLRFETEAVLEGVEPWWPHTHGTPVLYDASVDLFGGGVTHTLSLGRLGFRSLEADVADGGFGLIVNGAPVFCRGGCWITADPVGLQDDRERCERTLTLARDAGMNMIRIVGTSGYGSAAFYDVCDELGILVWQDFPFANMDYPGSDPDFRAGVEREVDGALNRLQVHPSLAVLCGGSEVFQQAAMLGLPEDAWRNPIYDEVLPGAIRRWCPEVPYVASSPDGGALPFHVSRGVAHYFGVGAYLRPLADARHSDVKFTSECLGFANVPEPAAVESLMGGGTGIVHDPRWKARVPRDGGAGWDFEDIRDHYFRELLGLDPLAVRYHDPERYLALSRVVTGEIMASAFAEWRRDGSHCRGGLVWFLRDLWLGAGWGVIDATDIPKACYYYLRRACAPFTVLLTDEGMNGLRVHGVNDLNAARTVTLEARLLRADGGVTAEGTFPLDVPARGRASVDLDAILGRFTDAAWVHRFGPSNHDVVAVTAQTPETGETVGEAYWFIDPVLSLVPEDFLAAEARPDERGEYVLTVTATRVARAVSIEARGYVPEDNYFNLQPHRPRTVRLRPVGDVGRFRAHVGALNASHAVRVKVDNAERNG